MKEELKRREYCKTTSLTKSLIAFVVCLVFVLFFSFLESFTRTGKKRCEDCIEGRL